LLVAWNGPARFLACPAELGTRRARDHMIRRAAQHEVGARLAQLSAVEQNADEIDFRVLTAAARETVLKRQRADGVAVETLLDALLHRIVSVLVLGIVGSHGQWDGFVENLRMLRTRHVIPSEARDLDHCAPDRDPSLRSG
jgi:hypothetical protein